MNLKNKILTVNREILHEGYMYFILVYDENMVCIITFIFLTDTRPPCQLEFPHRMRRWHR